MQLANKRIVTDKSVEVISLTHRGQEITWQQVERAKRDEGVDIFEQLNGFWSEQPQEWQDQVFDLYAQIYRQLNHIEGVYETMMQLMTPIAKLLDMHDLAKIRFWVDFRSTMQIPAGVNDTWNEDERARWTREKTYTLEDYKDLMPLTIAIRAMLPIWGEFIFLTKSNFEAKWKEYFAFQLISQAQLRESAPMKRLETYIKAMLPGDEQLNGAVLDGLSTEEYPEMVLATIMIRRVAFMDIRGLPDKANPISFLSQYLQKRTRNGNNMMGEVRDKRDTDSSGTSDENKLSWFEDYKVKEPVTTGEIMVIEQELQDGMLHRPVSHVAPGISAQLWQEAVANFQELNRSSHYQIQKVQVTLAQYVLSDYISARSLRILDKHYVVNAIALSQAILWHWGFKDLAALITARVLPVSTEARPVYAGVIPKIPSDVAAELAELFPYVQPAVRKSHKEISPVLTAINLITEMLKERDWMLTLPPSWLEQMSRSDLDRRYNLPLDIKTSLCKLIIKIARNKSANRSNAA